MKNQISKVEEFQKMASQLVNEKPTRIPIPDFVLRFDLMQEENEEYIRACFSGNLVEIGDSLGDKLYVLLGTINAHGMQNVIEEVFNRIHENNMQKCPDGICKFSKNGKLLKPKDFEKVKLEDLFI